MRIWLLRISSVVLMFASLAFFAASSAKADTYQIYSLGDGHRRTLWGLTASGEVVIAESASVTECGTMFGGCFELWVNGVQVGVQSSDPGLVYDGGSVCTPVSQFPGDIAAAKCNGSHEIYGTNRYADIPKLILDGPDFLSDTVASGYELDSLLLNSSGDFAFLANQGSQGTDGDGEIYEAIDLTSDAAPEPGGLLLVGTGLLAAVRMVRGRLLVTN